MLKYREVGDIMENAIPSKFKKYIDDTIVASDITISEENLKNSIVNHGNKFRVANVIKKAMRGDEIVISFFGGSITAGSAADAPPKEEYEKNPSFDLRDNTYCDHVCRWFKEMFACPVRKENAGIGATDTPYAVHRMGEDVLSKNPDLVIVEWCVNDDLRLAYKQGTYESMVRHFIESGVALIMFSMDTSYNSSSQSLHEPIAKHYNIPHISYRNAFADHPDFAKLSNDSVHPNGIGHPLAALILNYYLGEVYTSLQSVDNNDIVLSYDVVHEDGNIYNGAFIAPLKDVYEGKVEGVRIKSLGSFSIDSEDRGFGFKRYFGFTADSAEKYSPLVIEIDSCKTLFLQIFRSNANKGSLFKVKLNGETIESNTFTCMHGTDNSQTEWCYHWATERLCYFKESNKVELEILPDIAPDFPEAKVRIFALLLS